MLRSISHGTRMGYISRHSSRKLFARNLKTASREPVPEASSRINAGQGSPAPWDDILYGSNEGDTRNIVIEDLKATIDAHRTSNSGKTIRKVPLKAESRHGAHSAEGYKEEENTSRKWTDKDTQTLPEWYPKHVDPSLYAVLMRRTSLLLSWNVFEHARPWLAYTDCCSGDGLLRLEEEINAFTRYMAPTKAEVLAVENVIGKIQSLAGVASVSLYNTRPFSLTTHPLEPVELVWSCAYPSDSPSKFSEDGSPEEALDKAGHREAAKMLKRLYAELQSDQAFSKKYFVSYSTSGKIYVVQNEPLPRLRIKIIPSTTNKIQIAEHEFMVHYFSEFPNLRLIFILLCHALKIRDMDRNPSGKFDAYGLLALFLTALKHSPRPLDPDDTVGQLLQILEFCANLDTLSYQYQANPPQVRPKQQQCPGFVGESIRADYLMLRRPSPSCRFVWSLSLLDPLNPLKNLGMGLWQIRHIQYFFAQAKHEIQSRMCKWEQMSLEEREEWNEGLLDPLVEADYTEFETCRTSLERAGWKRSI